MNRMTFITYSQLYQDVLALDAILPRNIAGVVGVPRSGMTPASILALHRNLPLSSVCRLCLTGAFMDHGPRLESRVPKDGPILVIDDSIYMGTQMQRVRERLEADQGHRDFIFAAVYGSDQTPDDRQVDYVSRVVTGRRLFAWNLFHGDAIERSMLDMDGVICHDPPVFDDGPEGAYARWLPEAVPFHVPTRRVAVICTNRLETWRDETTIWLARHNVDFGELRMFPALTPEERRLMEPVLGTYKGQVYAESECTLFIESDHAQAAVIAKVSGKPVIALDTGEVFS